MPSGRELGRTSHFAYGSLRLQAPSLLCAGAQMALSALNGSIDGEPVRPFLAFLKGASETAGPVATAVSKCSSVMLARDCQRLDWSFVMPKSAKVTGLVAGREEPPLCACFSLVARSPDLAACASIAPAWRSARTFAAQLHNHQVHAHHAGGPTGKGGRV